MSYLLTYFFNPQIVQARMWAQGLTIGLLIVAGALTQSRRIEEARSGGKIDHSWRDVVCVFYLFIVFFSDTCIAGTAGA